MLEWLAKRRHNVVDSMSIALASIALSNGRFVSFVMIVIVASVVSAMIEAAARDAT